MDTAFMNSGNIKTSEKHAIIIDLSDRLDLRRGEKIIALSNLSIYYKWKNIKSSYNNHKLKISAPTWNDKFESPDGLYSISNIQDYFEYILEKYGENMDNPSKQIYVNKIETTAAFKIKDGCNLELVTPDKMKLLESTKKKITKDQTTKMCHILKLQK